MGNLALVVVSLALAQAAESQQATCGPVCVEWRSTWPRVKTGSRGSSCPAAPTRLAEGEVRFSLADAGAVVVAVGQGLDALEVREAVCSPGGSMLALPGKGAAPMLVLPVSEFGAFVRGDRSRATAVPLVCDGVTPVGWVSAHELRFVFGCGHGAMLGQVNVRAPTKLWVWTDSLPVGRPGAPTTANARLFERDPRTPRAPLEAPRSLR